MGTLYATGTSGVAQDDKQALDWFQKAAGQGFAKAEKNSATCISSATASTRIMPRR